MHAHVATLFITWTVTHTAMSLFSFLAVELPYLVNVLLIWYLYVIKSEAISLKMKLSIM